MAILNQFKRLIALAAIGVGIVFFALVPAHAAGNGLDATNNGSVDSKSVVNGEARGTANFTMSFSGSGTTKGNFDHSGMMQNMFGAENKDYPYYYAPSK